MIKNKSTRWRKKCVAIAKKIIKIRDNRTCQKCSKKCCGKKAQASHIYSEGRNKSMSADPENMKVLCLECHHRWHQKPTESWERAWEKRPERMASLQEKNKSINRSGALYFEELYYELRELLEKVEQEHKELFNS